MSHTVVIGGGPAGLTAAYELTKHDGQTAVVYEMDSQVGGISRTVERDGYRFDIGGHRFFTKVKIVQELWEEILDEDFLTRPRLSRIYYKGKFFHYPLKPMNALAGLGPFEAVRIGFSYMWAQVSPHPEERNLEQWVSNRFGRRLFEIFFKTYTEKVWGIPCTEISADWAAQRIKNLDLVAAVKNALIGSAGAKNKGEVITTLIDQFHYPRLGPGQMWEHCVDRLAERSVPTVLNAGVETLHREGNRIVAATVCHRDGRTEEVRADHFISSMPLRTLVRCLEPAAPASVLQAADRLKYRDFLTVVLLVNQDELFPDNWIYIHSPEVQVGRVQNFKNWSPHMVADPRKSTLGLEYFVQEGDNLWSMADDDLVELGRKEMAALNLVEEKDVETGWVVRMPKAYPVYDDNYQPSVREIQGYLESFENLQTVGRNGQHRYNNQDHSMVTGVWAARNVAGAAYDIWSVNVEKEYHEEVAEGDQEAARKGDRLVPGKVKDPTLEEMVRWAFAQYDAVALGVALGVVMAVGAFAVTAAALLGPEPRGPMLQLLGNYFLGYQVTWPGAFLLAGQSALGGFVFGWLIAKAVNLVVAGYENTIRRELQVARTLDPLEVGE
jgi:protoporphyrinogen oxidase